MNTAAYVGDTFPDTPVAGMISYRSDVNMMFVYDGTNWVMMTTSIKKWNLFLDDERWPAEAGWDGLDNVEIARSSADAEKMVEGWGLPSRISFDHDLGGEDTAFKFMWWLINGHLDEKWNLATVTSIQIHSANPEGAKKLIALWDNFCRVHKIECEITRVWPGAKE